MRFRYVLPAVAWLVFSSNINAPTHAESACAAGAVHYCDSSAGSTGSPVCTTSVCGDCGPIVKPAACRHSSDCGPLARTIGCGFPRCATCENSGVAKRSPACDNGCAQKTGCGPETETGSDRMERRRLAAPCGSLCRPTSISPLQRPLMPGFHPCDVCQVDSRREAIFGTATIFDDTPLSRLFAARCGRAPLVRHSLAAHRPRLKPSCADLRVDQPILDGVIEEPGWDDNPFHDDAVEPTMPLPVAPPSLPSRPSSRSERSPAQPSIESSAAGPALHPPANLQVGPARPLADHDATPSSRVSETSIDELTGKRVLHVSTPVASR